MAENKRDILLQKARAKRELQKRKARDDFWAFCLYCDPKFFVKRPFLILVAFAFMRVYEAYKSGVIRRLAVSMPPRAGKSYICSLFIAWMFGHYPEESVMRNCCSDTLYNKLSYDTRSIMRSRKFAEVFPDVKLKGDKQNVHGWNLAVSRQVGYFGAGVGGTVIGFGASMLAMTDDLYKSLEEALSDTNNEKIWSWKQGTHDSRIEGNCCSIDIGTRWSATDVIGRMEEMGKYDEIIRIPALDENDETFCADVHTTVYYRELRDDLDDSIWEAEYQQNPIELKGLLFPKHELNRFKKAELAGKTPLGCIAGCDTADKGTDDLCAPFAKAFGDRLFITDVVFTQDPVEVTMPGVAQKIIDTKCDKIRIESNNGGRTFSITVGNLIKKKSHCEIQAKATSDNKGTRILMNSGYIKSTFWFLDESEYEKGSDYDRFMKALTRYKKEGGNKHDDAPDGLTILAEFVKSVGLKFKKVRKVARRVAI